MYFPLPTDESARQRALACSQLLHTPPEPAFDRITALAGKVFNVPVALISFVDGDRHWFESKAGFQVRDLPADLIFYVHTIMREGVLVVPDAAADARFAQHPLITGPAHIRFYAGTPLVTTDGRRLGAFCLLDTVPRTFTEEQAAALKEMAGVIVVTYENRRANADLTNQIASRQGAEDALRRSESRKAAILNASLDGIISIDHAGKVLDLNPVAERMFGFTEEQAVGREMAELIIPAKERDAYRRGIRRFLETGEGSTYDQRLELRAQRADGTKFPVELSIMRTAAGGPSFFTGYIRDITERRAVETRLRMLESSLDNANDAVIITEAEPVDLPGPRIIYCNKAFTRSTGYTFDEVFGKTPRILQGPKTDPVTRANIREALRAWQPIRVELLNYRKDGSEFWIELVIVPVANAKGWYTHWVSVQRDITERKAIEQALERACAEAESANRAKSEFLSRMSHELRTPLNAILGFGQLLEMGNLPGRQSEGVKHIIKAGRHLLSLIDDVLSISRIEAGNINLSLEAVSVFDMMSECLDLVSLQARERGVRCHDTSGESAVGRYRHVRADRQRLRQVLLNLLSNAIKYNREGGGVTLSCREVPTRHGVEEVKVRLEVSEPGSGCSRMKSSGCSRRLSG